MPYTYLYIKERMETFAPFFVSYLYSLEKHLIGELFFFLLEKIIFPIGYFFSLTRKNFLALLAYFFQL